VFNLSSGIASLTANASVVACGNGTASTYFIGNVGVSGLNFSVPASRWYWINVTWVYHDSVALGILSAKGNSTYVKSAYAAADINENAPISDLTTGTGQVPHDTVLRAGPMHHVGKRIFSNGGKTFSMSFQLPLTAGDNYTMGSYVVFSLRVGVWATAPPGTVAWARESILASFQSLTLT
jgi:hypothetical protein